MFSQSQLFLARLVRREVSILTKAHDLRMLAAEEVTVGWYCIGIQHYCARDRVGIGLYVSLYVMYVDLYVMYVDLYVMYVDLYRA